MATPIYLHIICDCFRTTVAEWSSCDNCSRDQMDPQREKYFLSGPLQKKFGSLWSMPEKAVSETEYLQLINYYLLSTFQAVSQAQWNPSVCYIWPRYVCCNKDLICTKHTFRD